MGRLPAFGGIMHLCLSHCFSYIPIFEGREDTKISSKKMLVVA
ncbi:putative signal peptide protein [Puccinia sorghi]|uniref:Putative signal peptide protein n=1 Tax=Puccinia sorghi TaxID=27349 RepID=A0A0L6VGA4_9BASI|nr:putative signal peptide protein [Puccinia sorghi]